MNNNGKIYKTRREREGRSIEYLFVSHGETDIDKIIQYQYVGKINNKPIFNLGFGDYYENTTQIIDNIVSNNGDVYTVFNTVLSTIPELFNMHPNAIIMVRGSDSGSKFIQSCRQTCKKNCQPHCKKENRRITIYREYINKNYDSLNKEYTFFGNSGLAENQVGIENYRAGEKYTSIFVIKK